MKAYGLRKKIMLNLVDHHPPKGWKNWWEVEMCGVSKGSARQKSKREIKKIINTIEVD